MDQPDIIKILLTVLAVIATALIVYKRKSANAVGHRDHLNKNQGGRQTDNDKIIVINGAESEDVKKVLHQFCKLYNRESNAAILNVVHISGSVFAITFPYDIGFPIFCFLVNYMAYPENIFYEADVKAWATTTNADEWITANTAEKKVMLYLPADDNEYDNLCLVTEDNFNCKLDFSRGRERKLENQVLAYAQPPINHEQLQGKQSEEIR